VLPVGVLTIHVHAKGQVMAILSEVTEAISGAPAVVPIGIGRSAPAEPLGPLLIRSRRRLGISQGRLAALLCASAGLPTLSRHEVSRWEREERIPTRFWRPWLALVLGVSVDAIEAGAMETRGRRRVATSPPWRMIEVRVDPGHDGRLQFTPIRTTRYRP
jgi:transcriptional regulator with XRE-family HTH domain